LIQVTALGDLEVGKTTSVTFRSEQTNPQRSEVAALSFASFGR
jgi:hypothetical protein